MSTKVIAISLITSLSILTAGCGNVHQGTSPSLVTIASLQAAQGNKPGTLSGSLFSDVVTMVKVDSVLVPTVFNDVGQVSMQVALKDTTASPSALNTVTFTHYHVEFRRTDGHNIEGVDVPYSFDSGLTFSVGAAGSAAGFELVRHTAKEDAPLVALVNSSAIINTIANVTFFGKDQSGNDVQVTGSIGIDFGNFGDPTS